ncbi:hypothetical protein KKE06_02515 [Candidatus Micrarchaeota archaeon]|nr:hypothetical protein [Candidatus Micrarchaeota archaeon]MBU1930291.1 hypothetical protein [Candidatus Micrarchaeota archaeon]
MTISVNDQVEKQFRKTVAKTIGTQKGTLGKAVGQAMEKWMEDKEQQKIARQGIALLGKFKMGNILYKHRDELHERD